MFFHRLNPQNKICLQIKKEKVVFLLQARLDNLMEMTLQIKHEYGKDVAKNAFNHSSFSVLHCLSRRFWKIKLTGFLAQGFGCQSHALKSLFYVYPKNVHQ